MSDAARAAREVPRLRVLGPGRDPDRADALLQTRGARAVVDRLLETVTYVVIEAPPTTESADAQTLATTAELAVLVVETGPTPAATCLTRSPSSSRCTAPAGRRRRRLRRRPGPAKPTRLLAPGEEGPVERADADPRGPERPPVPAPSGRDAVRR